MSEKYDCTKDVELHRFMVAHHLKYFFFAISEAIDSHDASKLLEPEKSMFDEFTPKLKELKFGSAEYKAALADMGEALKHHYENNRHHPEHFENGISGMTLMDVIEMVCDWRAAADYKGQDVNLGYLSDRFAISDQLQVIIQNTLDWFTSQPY